MRLSRDKANNTERTVIKEVFHLSVNDTRINCESFVILSKSSSSEDFLSIYYVPGVVPRAPWVGLVHDGFVGEELELGLWRMLGFRLRETKRGFPWCKEENFSPGGGVYIFGLATNRRISKFKSKANCFYFMCNSHVLCSLLVLLKENIHPKKGRIFILNSKMYGFLGINKQANLHSHFMGLCVTDYIHNTSYSETPRKRKQQQIWVNPFHFALPISWPLLCSLQNQQWVLRDQPGSSTLES